MLQDIRSEYKNKLYFYNNKQLKALNIASDNFKKYELLKDKFTKYVQDLYAENHKTLRN